LSCEALSSTRGKYAFTVFERVFKDFGLPLAIRTDNGVPFASPNSLFGLSRLSVWWLRLGIGIERIQPAHPEQNGRHERMHLTLKKEDTKPAAKNLLQQQGRFDHFIQEYNQERPHQALGMKYPAELYVSSTRPYRGLSDLEYPFHDRTITVTCCGRICIGRRKINLSIVFAGQNVGVKEVSDKVWLVSFMQYDLGFFDHETGRITSAENPFGAKVLPMCPAPCARVVVASRLYYQLPHAGESSRHDQTLLRCFQAEDGRTTHRQGCCERDSAGSRDRHPAAEPVAMVTGGA
jgi:putative transposase